MPQRLLKLPDYAGDYDHPGYGGITITLAEGNLHWAYRGMSRPLGIGTTIRWSCPRQPAACCLTGSPLSFSTDREGNIASLAAPLEPLVKDVVFTYTAAGDCTNPALGQHCTRAFRAMEAR